MIGRTNAVFYFLGNMREIIKQLFAKDSGLNRRISASVQRFILRDDAIFICSIVILFLALFALCAFHYGFPRDFWIIPLLYSMIFAPAFVLLSVLDIFKRGWTTARLFALLLSLFAVALVALLIYLRFQQFSAA